MGRRPSTSYQMEIPMKKTKLHADILTAFVGACGNCDDLNALLKGDLPAGMSNGESQALKEWADDWSIKTSKNG